MFLEDLTMSKSLVAETRLTAAEKFAVACAKQWGEQFTQTNLASRIGICRETLCKAVAKARALKVCGEIEWGRLILAKSVWRPRSVQRLEERGVLDKAKIGVMITSLGANPANCNIIEWSSTSKSRHLSSHAFWSKYEGKYEWILTDLRSVYRARLKDLRDQGKLNDTEWLNRLWAEIKMRFAQHGYRI